MGNINTHGKFNVFLTLDSGEISIVSSEIEKIYFVEDIFSYCITGKILFNDRQGLLEFGPLTGNEEITILYGVEEDVELTFDLYKINRIIPTWSEGRGMENFVEILFVDKMFYKLTEQQYSISWKDTKYSSIVEHIVDEILEPDEKGRWEGSIEEIEYFNMPYWTPKQTIDWLMARCRGDNSGVPGFLMYNNVIDGEITTNFVTLETLMDDEEMLDAHGSHEYNFHSGLNLDYNRILSYNMSGIDNHERMKLRGGTPKGYDIKRKKFIKEPKDYQDGIDEFTLLGRYSLYEDISEKNAKFYYTAEQDEDILENIILNKWVKQYATQQMMSIVVMGHENRYAGGMIEIDWPSSSENEIYNKVFTGKYLVKSVIHKWGSGSPYWQQKMVLIKNAFEDSENSELIKASKMNLGA